MKKGMAALRGMDEVLSALDAINREAPEATQEAVKMAAKDIGERARERAPRDTGELQKSLQVRAWKLKTGAAAKIKFAAPHAKLQHEHVEWAHPMGGEAKFLEKAALEKRDDLMERLLSLIGKRLGE